MAKIYYSALVNAMGGRLSHSVASSNKGINILKRHNPGVHQPRTEKQQDIRGFFSDLAGEYYSLTNTQKELWDSWCSMYKLPLSGFNAYIKFNQLIQKYLTGNARMTSPPPTPSTPPHVSGFTVVPITGTDFCVQWTAGAYSTVIAIVDYWAMPGRDSRTNPRWTFGSSAASTAAVSAVALNYPTGTIVKFRIRTMDTYGRVSPWSHILQTAAIT